MAIAGPAKDLTPALADSDEDEADKDLLLDWRGKGSGNDTGLMQQTLGFKQVKQRFVDAANTTVAKEQYGRRDEKRKAEVNIRFQNAVVVPLSDDEDDPGPLRPRRINAKAVSTSVKHADIVCLDSDSEPDVVESSAKPGENEEPVVRRSWEKASSYEQVRIVNYCSGTSKTYQAAPSAVSVDTEAKEDPSPGKCWRRASEERKALKESELRQYSHPLKTGAFLSEKARLKSNELCACPDVHANSTREDDAAEHEFRCKENVLSSRGILEAESAHEEPIGSPLQKRGNAAAERTAALSVCNFKDDTVPNSRNPRCSGLSDKDERIRSGFVISDVGLEKKRTLGKDCAQSQEWLRPEKSSQARIDFQELSADEGPSGRPHALRHIGGSNRDQRDGSVKISASHTCDDLAYGTRSKMVSLCELISSDEENIVEKIPSKRKCIRSVEDTVLEERPANVDLLNLDSQTSSLSEDGVDCRKIPIGYDAPSAYEAVKSVFELEKLEKKRHRGKECVSRSKLKDEERKRRQEEARKKKEELRQQKEAAKAEAAVRKKFEQECGKWKKGKFAVENTTVYLDTKIIESKSLGPPLLQQLANKEYKYQVVTNRIEKTIVWTMKMPTEDSKAILDALESQDDPVSSSQLPLEEVEIKYVVVFLDAADFTDMVAGDSINNHISRMKKEYPGYTICYLVNNLKNYINKKDQAQYRSGDRCWKRPNVEQVLAEFITHHVGVRSRICIDENEMAEHIVGLTRSLAECPFKPKLTSLAINANGEHITKNDPHRDVIRRDPWKKALAAIPNITGAAVIAISKVYPTMRSLLNVYLDPARTVLEKEFLLQDIVKDAALGSARTEGRRVGPVCSKRIYRLLMAQNGDLRTDAAEEGEDCFRDQEC